MGIQIILGIVLAISTIIVEFGGRVAKAAETRDAIANVQILQQLAFFAFVAMIVFR